MGSTTNPVLTGMRLSAGTEFPVVVHVADVAPDCDHDIQRVKINLRVVGWLDQKGNVWLSDRDWMAAGGPNGSVTPLLINPGCD